MPEVHDAAADILDGIALVDACRERSTVEEASGRTALTYQIRSFILSS